MAKRKSTVRRPRSTSAEHRYLHGFSETEQERLRVQARVTEPWVHDRLPFRRCRKLLEVGSGVGAQTEILLRHFPDIQLTCAENSEQQLEHARQSLDAIPFAKGRFELRKEDAMSLSFGRESFDAAFLCWILEHVPDPARVLAEEQQQRSDDGNVDPQIRSLAFPPELEDEASTDR